MTAEDAEPPDDPEDTVTPAPEPQATGIERASDWIDRFVNLVELSAAALFALLFGIGVVDLAIQIAGSIRSGAITDPRVVIGFIDTGLLLLIIVEVYQTVLAYIKQSDTLRIVELVVYTGVIAMVRKVIIFRTSEYPNNEAALLAALAYAIIIAGLIGLLWVERRPGTGPLID
ncbi:MAG: phosphate-starvation-inducible PsiE family protein [Halodesulfurarchaeum sp.]